MGIFDPVKDAAGWAGDKASDAAGFVAGKATDVKDFAVDEIAPVGLEAFRTAAWAGSEMLAQPMNRSAQMLSTVTGKDIPELHLIGESDSVKAVKEAIEPVTNVTNYVEHLGNELVHSASYAAVQQTTDGVSQLVNKAAGTDLIPHVDLIEKPEAADKWSAEWFMQQGGLAIGTAAPVMFGGSAIATRLGPKALGLAGVEVTAESGRAVQMASKLAGGMPVSFGFNFFAQPSEGDGNFWASRLQNGSIGAVMGGGQTALRTVGVLDNIGGEVVHTAVDTNARSALKGEGLAEPEDYVQGSVSKVANNTNTAVRSDSGN